MRIIKSVTAILLVMVLLLGFSSMQYSVISEADIESESLSEIDKVIFPHDEVVKVYIKVDEEEYVNMNENAMSEEGIMADITYNGYEFTSVSIRPKGNSSLKSVAETDSDRYSFKIDFDDYIDEQSFLGISKINLNNLFSDPTMMAEYLSYEMFDELGAVSSRTTYCEIYINDEYFGLYLAVEEVEEEFLIENYGDASGELYKPEMGTGSDLKYVSDNSQYYTGLVADNMDSDNEDIINLIEKIDSGESIDNLFNVDSYLKYLAISTLTVHLDSYQGNMFHNYYLYNNDGVFEWIPWDLNMTFNGFPMASLTDEEAVNLLIYEPVSGSMDSYPLVEFILSNDEYVEIYNGYMQELMDGYLSDENFEERVLEVYEMINSYVKDDPNSFYTYEEFEESLFTSTDAQMSINDFMSSRIENVKLQISGEIASTNDGNGNVGTATGNKKGNMQGGPPSAENTGGGVAANEGKAPNEGQAINGGPNPESKSQNTDSEVANADIFIEKLLTIVSLEDLPEEMLTYINSNQMPPKDLVDEVMESLSLEDAETLIEVLMSNRGADPGQMGGEPMGENTISQNTVEETSNSRSTPDDYSLIIISAFIMIIVSIYLARKH